MIVKVKITAEQERVLAEYISPEEPGKALITEMKGEVQYWIDSLIGNVKRGGGPFAPR